jgi:hypothetical protein
MSLTEAVHHVQAVESCSQIDALTQLRMALGDGDISARWAADPLPSWIYQVGVPPLFSSDEVPIDAGYWDSVLIFLDGDGRVIDQSFYLDEKEEKSPPRPRQLLLLRSRVLELWPPTEKTVHGANQTKLDTSQTPTRRASKEQIRVPAREMYQTKNEMGKKPPNTEEAERLLREKVDGATRPKIRAVLSEPEFEKLRLKRGGRWSS